MKNELRMMVCPRCGGQMLRGYEGHSCLQCGYTPYDNPDTFYYTSTGNRNVIDPSVERIHRKRTIQ